MARYGKVWQLRKVAVSSVLERWREAWQLRFVGVCYVKYRCGMDGMAVMASSVEHWRGA